MSTPFGGLVSRTSTTIGCAPNARGMAEQMKMYRKQGQATEYFIWQVLGKSVGCRGKSSGASQRSGLYTLGDACVVTWDMGRVRACRYRVYVGVSGYATLVLLLYTSSLATLGYVSFTQYVFHLCRLSAQSVTAGWNCFPIAPTTKPCTPPPCTSMLSFSVALIFSPTYNR